MNERREGETAKDGRHELARRFRNGLAAIQRTLKGRSANDGSGASKSDGGESRETVSSAIEQPTTASKKPTGESVARVQSKRCCCLS